MIFVQFLQTWFKLVEKERRDADRWAWRASSIILRNSFKKAYKQKFYQHQKVTPPDVPSLFSVSKPEAELAETVAMLVMQMDRVPLTCQVQLDAVV